MKLYVLFLKYTFTKDDCYLSLDILEKGLRTSIYNISKTLKKLESGDYIKKQLQGI